jgi:phosphoglycerol transferase
MNWLDRDMPASRVSLSDRRELLFTAATGLLALLLLVPVLRLWELAWRVPLNYGADATFYLMIAKDAVRDGSYLTNGRLGAPFGQDLHDFPLGGDHLNIAVIEGLGLFTDDPALVVNVFYLLTYPCVAIAAVAVARKLGLSRPAAALCAVLFAMLPYHFVRAEDHLFLSAYVAVPVGTYFALATLGGRRLLVLADLRAHWRMNGAVVVGCILVGSTGLYYAFFSVLVLVAATLTAFVVRRDLAVLGSGLAVAGVIAAVVVVNLSPSIVHELRHGANPVALDRQPQESERFGLKLTQLLLPINDHRVSALAQRSQYYDETSGASAMDSESLSQSLGLIGTVGFFALLGAALAGTVASPRSLPPALLRHAAFVALVAVLYGITGGFSSLFAYSVSPNFHAPARIAVMIGFLALLAVGVLVDAIARRALPLRHRDRWLALSLVPVLAVGVADQTSPRFVPNWSGVRATWDADRATVATLERVLPHEAMVFQLPHVRFPGSGVASRMFDYDHARPFIHGDELHWSFGAMKGRPEDWSDELAEASPRIAVTAAAAAGFDAVWLDRFGYADNGQAVERELRALLGDPLLEGGYGREVVFDLRDYRRTLAARGGRATVARAGEAAVHPMRWTPGETFYPLEVGGGHSWRWAWQPVADIELENPSGSDKSVVFSTRLAAASGSTVEIAYPDGVRTELIIGNEPLPLRRSFVAPPGRSSITISTNAEPTPGAPGDPRSLYLQLSDTVVLDTGLCRIARC